MGSPTMKLLALSLLLWAFAACVLQSAGQRGGEQCKGKPQGTPCQKKCQAPDCKEAKCFYGLCKRGIAYNILIDLEDNVKRKQQCQGRANGTSCDKRCKAADCRLSMCYEGECKRGR